MAVGYRNLSGGEIKDDRVEIGVHADAFGQFLNHPNIEAATHLFDQFGLLFAIVAGVNHVSKLREHDLAIGQFGMFVHPK